MEKTIIVDFDGTICDFAYPECGQPKEGVCTALWELHDMGYKIVVHSLRTSSTLFGVKDRPNQLHHTKMLVDYLIEHKIPHDEVLLSEDSDKPAARFYIDDCAVRFNNNWAEVVREIKERER